MALGSEDILRIFQESGALLEGHFILTSGLHSNRYFQCAKVFQYPWHSDILCSEMAALLDKKTIDTVISPAIGGIVFGQDLARHLGVRAIFTERKDGVMMLRRGFDISPGEKLLVAEDVTTTGGSVKDVMEVVREKGGEVTGVAAVVDRSGGKVDFGLPYTALFRMEVETYQPESCPLCARGSKAVKPGSR